MKQKKTIICFSDRIKYTQTDILEYEKWPWGRNSEKKIKKTKQK